MFVSILVDGLGATIDVGALAPKIAAEGSFFGLVWLRVEVLGMLRGPR